MDRIFEKHNKVRQVVLITDKSDERSNAFYRKQGMVDLDEINCIGDTLDKKN